jgi:hypothetical protein
MSRAAPVVLGENRSADIEAIFPSDFRFFSMFDGGSVVPEMITVARAPGRDRRDRFTAFLFAMARRADPRVAWLRPHVIRYETRMRQAARRIGSRRIEEAHALIGSADPLDVARIDETRRLFVTHGLNTAFLEWVYQAAWSLAQHYCITTALLDLTLDPSVAAWFATNPWSDRTDPPTSGRGVIYRFNVPLLRLIFGKMNAQRTLESLERREVPPAPMFVVDISKIPGSFAARPGAQRGLSVFGFDQPQAIQFAFFSDAAEAFTFEHGCEPYTGARVNRASIQPEIDPFHEVVAAFTQSAG